MGRSERAPVLDPDPEYHIDSVALRGARADRQRFLVAFHEQSNTYKVDGGN